MGGFISVHFSILLNGDDCIMMAGTQNSHGIISKPITPASYCPSSKSLLNKEGKVYESTNKAIGKSSSVYGKKVSTAEKIACPKVSIAEAVVSNGTIKKYSAHLSNSIWTHEEEKTLVNHIQNCFDPNFNPSKVFAMLTEKSEEDIKQKWKSIASSFLDYHERREIRIAGNEKSADDHETPSPPKKMKAGGDMNISSWTYEEKRRLQEIMKSHNHLHHGKFLLQGIHPHIEIVAFLNINDIFNSLGASLGCDFVSFSREKPY